MLAEVDNTYGDLGYSGYLKTRVLKLCYYTLGLRK